MQLKQDRITLSSRLLLCPLGCSGDLYSKSYSGAVAIFTIFTVTSSSEQQKDKLSN